ncbi:MAG: DNA-directed RNA polymerase [Candidatus Diapherotrites archaeon]|nr:DNA-directed RNA polymerase [Candidatus Diapherotrites archaeon]
MQDKFGRTLYKAICSDCGKECEVPFQPDGTRPVYCRECYLKRRGNRRFGRK